MALPINQSVKLWTQELKPYLEVLNPPTVSIKQILKSDNNGTCLKCVFLTLFKLYFPLYSI